MLNTPIAPWPSYSEKEVDAVVNVLRSNKVNYWTGVETREFEREFARRCQANYAVAVMNGTVALDLALYALRIGVRNGGSPTDEVIVTPRTFIASVSCVVNAGAKPVFADVDRDSGNLTANSIEKVVSERTRAAIVVHLAGWPCDMNPIMDLSNRKGFKVIEDCAQAHGALYRGRSVGGIGHIGAWSFCQDKIMTTGGEGGMVTTNDPELWEKMWSFKDHGKTWEAVYERKHPAGFRWLHERFGTNWRMLEMQAVIGRCQLLSLESWIHRRKELSSMLTNMLAEFTGPGGLVRAPDFCSSNCTSCHMIDRCRHARYKYYCYVNTELLAKGWSRDRIIMEISSAGVPVYQGSCSEVYLEKAFENTNWRPLERLPVASELGETSLMFLVHPTITDAQQEFICKIVRDVLRSATT